MGSKWYDRQILKRHELYKDQLLIAIGKWLKNQMVEMSHAISGLLRNSITFSTSFGKRSGFGNYGTGRPTESDRITQTTLRDSVRVGSAVVYANKQNIHNGWVDKSVDEFIRSKITDRFAKEIFKW